MNEICYYDTFVCRTMFDLMLRGALQIQENSNSFSVHAGAHQHQGSRLHRRHSVQPRKVVRVRRRTRVRPQTSGSSSVLPDQPASNEHLVRLQQPHFRGHPQPKGPDQVAGRVQRG